MPLDIPALGVDWYIGNLHKWMWVPRSSGILWASPSRQAGLHPAVVSWGLDQGFEHYADDFDLSKVKGLSLGNVQRRADEVDDRAGQGRDRPHALLPVVDRAAVATERERDAALADMASRHPYSRRGDEPAVRFEKVSEGAPR